MATGKEFWDWRLNEAPKRVSFDDVVQHYPCPYVKCQVRRGQPCKSKDGAPHRSRYEGYMGQLFVLSRAARHSNG
jgi:hypothetical protein